MPTIYSGEWLRQKRKEAGLTVEELAKACGLSPVSIYKIENGERIGYASTWKKITDFFKPVKISVDCDDLISELKEEIEEYGEDEECIVFYSVQEGAIIFYDYLMPEDMAESYFDEDLQDKSSIRISLKEALELFDAQNQIV